MEFQKTGDAKSRRKHDAYHQFYSIGDSKGALQNEMPSKSKLPKKYTFHNYSKCSKFFHSSFSSNFVSNRRLIYYRPDKNIKYLLRGEMSQISVNNLSYSSSFNRFCFIGKPVYMGPFFKVRFAALFQIASSIVRDQNAIGFISFKMVKIENTSATRALQNEWHSKLDSTL